MDKKGLEEHIKQFNPDAKVVAADCKEFVFELNIKMNCFYCGRYNNSWRCPPKTPDIDFPKMFAEYNDAMFVYQSFEVSDDNRDSIRTESSLIIHRTLLDAEKYLYENNIVTALSFIGGSCKLCKSGCGKEKCNNPYMARMPVEATGVNVIKTLAKKGIDVTFPTDKSMKRIGLIVWN